MIANALSSLLPRWSAASPGPLDDFWYYLPGRASAAGIDITPDNAQTASAVYACIRILREALSSLPFRVYERTAPRTSEMAIGNYLWTVLHDAPNRWQTAMEWLEMAVAHLCLRGNFYCKIIAGGTEEMELWPMNPDRMEVEQTANGDLTYIYHRQDGATEKYRQEDILHVRGYSLNGILGMSVLEYARHSIGLALAQSTHGASLFKNGGLPPAFWISRPGDRPWKEEAKKNFRRGWRGIHGGAKNAGNLPILEDGMELHELGMNNRDSQWVEAMKFSDRDISRFFGVWPEMIAVESQGSMASGQEYSKQFVDYTLRPLAVRFQQACNRDLVMDRQRFYTRIALDELRRANVKEQSEADNIGIQGGALLINEVREMNDRNPVEGGDIPRFPLNMQPVGGGPDRNEQGGQPGKGTPKLPEQKADSITRVTFIVLLDEAAERIVAAEIKALAVRADKAADDHAKWCRWAKDVYKRHRLYIAKTLTPICESWAIVNTTSPHPEDIAEELCETSQEVFDPQCDLPALLESWREIKAGRIGSYFQAKFFENKR